jgi:hypothetical protein
MKPEPLERSKEPYIAHRVRIKGKAKVVLDEADYEALLRRADFWEPDLPAPDANGNYPAAEALAVIQAQNILRPPQAGAVASGVGPARLYSS